jgi:hypothetical protein
MSVLFMDDWNMFLFDKSLMFLMDDRLDVLVDVLLNDHRLMMLMKNVLMMLMDDVFLVLNVDIHVVLMNHILMNLLDNRLSNMGFKSWSQLILIDLLSFIGLFEGSFLLVLDHDRFLYDLLDDNLILPKVEIVCFLEGYLFDFIRSDFSSCFEIRGEFSRFDI